MIGRTIGPPGLRRNLIAPRSVKGRRSINVGSVRRRLLGRCILNCPPNIILKGPKRGRILGIARRSSCEDESSEGASSNVARGNGRLLALLLDEDGGGIAQYMREHWKSVLSDDTVCERLSTNKTAATNPKIFAREGVDKNFGDHPQPKSQSSTLTKMASSQ